MQGTTFGDVPLNLECKLEVWDSPNSAGAVIDAIRRAKLALERGIAGALYSPSSHFMKTPPKQFTDNDARSKTEAFIRGDEQRSARRTDLMWAGPDAGRPCFSTMIELVNLYRAASLVVPYVPPGLGYRICEILGSALGPQLPAFGRIQRNLRVLMPKASESEQDRAAKRVLGGIFKNYFDLFRFHTLSPAELSATCVWEGAEHVDRALAQGHGLLMVAPHAGNYSIIFAPMILQFNAQMLLVVEQLQDRRVHELMNRARQGPGIAIEPLGPNVGRVVLRALRQNHIVLLAGDRAIAENAVTVQFFGRPTPLPSGPATLALRTRAPLLTAFTHRLPDQRSWVCFDPPLRIERSRALHDDIRDVTQKIAYIMQAYIRRDPAQWLVVEDVWPNG